MRVMWLAPYLERISYYIMTFFVSDMLLILPPHSAAKDSVCRRNFCTIQLAPVLALATVSLRDMRLH
jgi:hypothetical protein